MRERGNVFKTHPNLLKFASTKTKNANAVQKLRAGAPAISKDYVTKADNLETYVADYKFASFKWKRSNLWAHSNFLTATATYILVKRYV